MSGLPSRRAMLSTSSRSVSRPAMALRMTCRSPAVIALARWSIGGLRARSSRRMVRRVPRSGAVAAARQEISAGGRPLPQHLTSTRPPWPSVMVRLWSLRAGQRQCHLRPSRRAPRAAVTFAEVMSRIYRFGAAATPSTNRSRPGTKQCYSDRFRLGVETAQLECRARSGLAICRSQR
jgi:hypothetical protein